MNNETELVILDTETSNTNTSQKHSIPFYISPTIFQNKRLKHKRLKWLSLKNTILKKTESRKHIAANLKPKLTIDLSSDDENADAPARELDKQQQQKLQIQNIYASIAQAQLQHNPQLVSYLQKPLQPNYQHFFLIPQIQLADGPNIALVPITTNSNSIAKPKVLTIEKYKKKSRKSRAPKRLAEPTLINNESIVLTDDSDSEGNNRMKVIQNEKQPTKITTVQVSPLSKPPLPVPPLAPITPSVPKANALNKSPTKVIPSQNQLQLTATQSTKLQPTMAHIDDEVTVSIVPRSSTTSNCARSRNIDKNELFPMLPDETTVHTVIANRSYELSLTKLREGLASCGIPEFEVGKQNNSPVRRSKNQQTPPFALSTTPQPISLKLSSDLSISLISDDDDEEVEECLTMTEQLLQNQPQLSVQQVQVPMTSGTTMLNVLNNHMPRRR